jgi:hypothetical protein
MFQTSRDSKKQQGAHAPRSPDPDYRRSSAPLAFSASLLLFSLAKILAFWPPADQQRPTRAAASRLL